jgi:hypothetical protein
VSLFDDAFLAHPAHQPLLRRVSLVVAMHADAVRVCVLCFSVSVLFCSNSAVLLVSRILQGLNQLHFFFCAPPPPPPLNCFKRFCMVAGLSRFCVVAPPPSFVSVVDCF